MHRCDKDFRKLVSCCFCNNVLFQTNIIIIDNIGNICKKCFNAPKNKDLFKNNSNMRNKSLEEYLLKANERNIKCQYEEYGCSDILKLKDINDHEKICNYKLVDCPLQDMSISLAKLTTHFKNLHKDKFISMEDASFKINFGCQCYTCYSITIVSLHDHTFLLKYSNTLRNSKFEYAFFYCANTKELAIPPKHFIKFIGESGKNLCIENETVGVQEFFNYSKKLIEIDLVPIVQFLNSSKNINFKISLSGCLQCCKPLSGS